MISKDVDGRWFRPSLWFAVLQVAIAGLLLANLADGGVSDGWLVVLGWAAVFSAVLAAVVEVWRFWRYRRRQRAETEV